MPKALGLLDTKSFQCLPLECPTCVSHSFPEMASLKAIQCLFFKAYIQEQYIFAPLSEWMQTRNGLNP